MKKRLPAFLAGMLTTALVCGLTVSALAANGLLTIDVDPSVTIKVNGEVFQPKNEQGEDVMVFKFKGTTYAPVRALAEAYGLKVGFDQSTNMATVDAADDITTPTDTTAPPADYSDWTPEEEAAYQEFKAMWEVELGATPVGSAVDLRCYNTEDTVNTFLSDHAIAFIEKCCLRFDLELYQQFGAPEIMYHFTLRESWGWEDSFLTGEWECGYKRFLEH